MRKLGTFSRKSEFGKHSIKKSNSQQSQNKFNNLISKIPFIKQAQQEKVELSKSNQLSKTVLKEIVPGIGYVFHSDYFEIENEVGQILSIIPEKNADRSLPLFWTYRLLPKNLGNDVKTHFIQQISTKEKKWIDDNLVATSKAINQSIAETKNTSLDKQNVSDQVKDLFQIQEDVKGGKYHGSEFKVLLKAPNIDALDRAREKYKLDLAHDFEGVTTDVFEGQQLDDFKNIFHSPDNQLGREKKMYSSYELAGSYYLLSKGIEDMTGEYVGIGTGDYNNSATIFDVDNWDDHIIVASDFAARTLSHSKNDYGTHLRMGSLWGMKIAQAALIEDHRVVHLVLNNTSLHDIHDRKLGIDIRPFTVDIMMGKGAINPFEAFGNEGEEGTAYAVLAKKLRLMMAQLSPDLTSIDLNKYFTEIFEAFMIDSGFWKPNAKENLDTISLLGLPHKEYKVLHDFYMYLDTYLEIYKKQNNSQGRESVERLQGAFKRMKDENGDLFDLKTNESVDETQTAPQVIYDFADILDRGKEIAMAQLINSLGYATQNLKRGDVVIIHGTEYISNEVKEFVGDTLDRLHKRDVRVAFIYDNLKKAIKDREFNQINSANYTIFGSMTNDVLEDYIQTVGATMPVALKDAIQSRDDRLIYLSRGKEKALFELDLIL